MGAQELIIILVMLLVVAVPLGLVIWSVVDVARRSEQDFEGVSGTRMLWLVLPILLTPIGLGWIAALIYLASVRPKLPQQPQAAATPPAA